MVVTLLGDAGIQSQLSLNCNKKAQQHVLKELLVTEKSYVVKLQCIKELYDYLQQHADPEKQKPQISITRQEFNEIFNTLNEIWGVNVAFLKDLETCVYQGRSSGDNEGQGEIDLGRLASVVRTHLPHMHIYGRFISTFEKRIELYKELYKTDEFVDLMGNFETSTQVFDDPGYIENLLIEPVQRIGRYCLLLKELMKVTTPADEGYEELRKAEKVAKETANKVNALPEVVEQSMFMHKIGWLITGFPDTYLSGTRRFISAHSVNETTHFPTFETCHKKTVLLLFNDILVIAKGVIPSELNGCNANDFISWCGRVKGGAFRFKEVVKLGKCKIGVVNNGSGCQIFYTKDDGQDTVASLTVPKSTLKDNFKRFMSKLYDAKVGLEYQNQPNCSIYRQTVDDVNVYFHVYRRNAYDMSSIKNKITLYYHSTSDIPTLSASASVEQSPYMVGFIQALPGAGGPPRFKYLVRSRIEFERENGTAQDENEGSIMEGDKVGPALGEHSMLLSHSQNVCV
ncbi:Dbl homology domain-containing protein [Paraphysoderma sedebokerense]|nr:Dbl homology domain-containing protein [Paraphysoderma sedebokerense]